MCGIVAYLGPREAQPLLLNALTRLEYRGYDSAGLALLSPEGLQVYKRAGRIADLRASLPERGCGATVGISHTRWATHGAPDDINAHPHLDQSGRLALVHNGVIENHQALRRRLVEQGHRFLSQTDTEVLAHLVGAMYDRLSGEGDARLLEALRAALREVKGTYGLALVHQDVPGVVLGARNGSPLVLGIGDDEMFLSSDANALIGHTTRVVYLRDGDLVTLHQGRFELENAVDSRGYEVEELAHKAESADKGDFEHFMLKEIFEQPQVVQNAMRGRLDPDACTARLGGLNLDPTGLRNIDRIVIVACGTARHAGLVAENMIEALCHIPVEVEYASEFRYHNAPLDRNTIFFAVSQSGETADTLGALREAQRKGYRCLGVCNVVGSTIARESDGGVYMHAGPEIGVAATKSFVSQVTVFSLLALLLGRMRHLSAAQGKEWMQALEALPEQISQILSRAEEVRQVACAYVHSRSMLFLGRQVNYPVALEGALKMKEISYIHAEGYPSSELKHGVIALIDRELPSVFIAPRDSVYDKNLNSIQEVKARGGPVIAVATEGDEEIGSLADAVLYVPQTLELLQPILTVVPLQLLAYFMACELGRDVDKPRNLAKSVTVE